MTSSQEQVKPDNRLLRALQRLVLLGCHVTFQDDWKRPHCFTVDFEMQPRLRGRLEPMRPFYYLQPDGTRVFESSTHTHTGFPDCTEEQGLTQLCQALENVAETIENHHKTKLIS